MKKKKDSIKSVARDSRSGHFTTKKFSTSSKEGKVSDKVKVVKKGGTDHTGPRKK